LKRGQSRAIRQVAKHTEMEDAPLDEMVIRIPEKFKYLGEAMQRMLEVVKGEVESQGGGRAVACRRVEQLLAEETAKVEQAAMREWLRSLDVDAPRVVVEGRVHARVGRCEGTYWTQAGPVKVERSLYREVGRRNARVVDAISLRAGVVEDGWLPGCAQAMAYLLGQGTSREAQATAGVMGRLPYSRSSFERVGHAVGELYVARQADIEAEVAQERQVPEEASSVSMSLDRVSVAMEEPRGRPRGRPRQGAPKKPVARVWRMAYVGCVTLHDKEGNALTSRRYGCMPGGDEQALCEGMKADVALLRRKHPELKEVHLCDGAREMWNLLSPSSGGQPVTRLIDYWHLVEKLGPVAQVLQEAGGEQAGQVLERWKLSLLNSSRAARRILEELEGSGLEHVRRGEERPVHDAITYLRNGMDRMDYASARALGLPIGSGNVEAACKSLVSVRMRRPGARWKHASGNNVLQLRALMLSDCWGHAMQLTLDPLRTSVSHAP
jgi:hypothetical protein